MKYIFDRYRNGVKMAQGVTIQKAESFEQACCLATKLGRRDGFRIDDVLVLSRVIYGDD